MELKGYKVNHTAFGDGTIIRNDEIRLYVQFPMGEKAFIYPDAFLTFLTIDNTDIQKELVSAAKKKLEEKLRKDEEEKIKLWGNSKSGTKAAKLQRANAAIKCNYNDGEKPEEEISFTSKALSKVQKNSLCVRTTRAPKSTEAERFIYEVFLIDESRDENNEDAYLTTNSEFKIELEFNEAKNFPFWKYYKNPSSDKVVWSQGLIKYFDDEKAVQILKDIAGFKKGTSEEELADRFLQEYCLINHIDLGSVKEPSGALSQVEKLKAAEIV